MAQPNTGMIADWYSQYAANQPKATADGTPSPPAGQGFGSPPQVGQTVAGNVAALTSSGSPLNQAVAANINDQYAGRGLLNSSMAIGAGQKAVIDTATPIAAQDASTWNQAHQADLNRQFTTSERQGAQGFQTGENALDRANRLSLQSNDQSFLGTQAGLNRQFSTSERQGTQGFQTGESALDRANRLSLQSNDQTFQGTQAGLARTQQTALQDSSQAFQGTQQQANRDLQTGLQTSAQNFQGTQAALTFDRTKALNADQYQQQQTLLEKQLSGNLKMYDAQTQQNVLSSYRAYSTDTYDKYTSAINQIQTSDMTPEVKQAQVQQLNDLYSARQTFGNQLYSLAPQWSADWKQLGVTFG